MIVSGSLTSEFVAGGHASCGELLAHEATASREIVAVPGHALGLDSEAVSFYLEGAFADDGHCLIIKVDAVIVSRTWLLASGGGGGR